MPVVAARFGAASMRQIAATGVALSTAVPATGATLTPTLPAADGSLNSETALFMGLLEFSFTTIGGGASTLTFALTREPDGGRILYPQTDVPIRTYNGRSSCVVNLGAEYIAEPPTTANEGIYLLAWLNAGTGTVNVKLNLRRLTA